MRLHARSILISALAVAATLCAAGTLATNSPVPVAAAPVAAANVAGTWNMTVTSRMGTSTPSVILKQNGAKLTGTYKGRMGESPLTGTMTGNAMHLEIPLSVMGSSMLLTYDGVVEGDAIKGKNQMGQMGGGTFTGKRQP